MQIHKRAKAAAEPPQPVGGKGDIGEKEAEELMKIKLGMTFGETTTFEEYELPEIEIASDEIKRIVKEEVESDERAVKILRMIRDKLKNENSDISI